LAYGASWPKCVKDESGRQDNTVQDPVGNRLNRTSTLAPVPSQSSTYDANDRLTSDNYDNNGNTTSANSDTYAYDFENHLTSLNGGSAGYVYDGFRVARTVGGVTTNYLVDSNNPTGHAQVVEELQGGLVTRQFTYGHTRISQRIVGGSLSFYQYDGHGSVRSLTDALGAITDAYDYDAFGNLIYHAGTTSNDYLYTGEHLDANLGFYYLRARFMNPGSGRFLSMDAVDGSRFDPASLHRYTYVSNNPANLIDPRGEFALMDTLAAVVSNAICFYIEYQSFFTAARLILAGLNLYLLGTNERYRGNFLAGGPQFANAVIADDLSAIAAAPSRFSGAVFEASSLEPFAVRHATTNPNSVLNGIDPTFASVDSRFGPGFYVGESGQTAVNEVAAHGSSYTYVIRFDMNLNGQRVLDLTRPAIAEAWGYNSTLNYTSTQAIAQRASQQGYTVIAYPAVQGAGTNFAVLRQFNEILRPMGISPGW
jgi:RHS repeat-associated protein